MTSVITPSIKENNGVLNNNNGSCSDEGQERKEPPVENPENGNEEEPNKRPKTNFRDPSRLANIKAAIEYLLKQDNAGVKKGSRRTKNLKEVSRQFNIPYNTLRDNFLRVTTGQVRQSSVKAVFKNRKLLHDYNSGNFSFAPDLRPVPFPVQMVGFNSFNPFQSSVLNADGAPFYVNNIPSAMSFQPQPNFVGLSGSNNMLHFPASQQLNFNLPTGPYLLGNEIGFSDMYYPVPPMSESMLFHAAALSSSLNYFRQPPSYNQPDSMRDSESQQEEDNDEDEEEIDEDSK